MSTTTSLSPASCHEAVQAFDLSQAGPSILLIGKPNSGKSRLFNRLTGLQHQVANFPGITVDVSSGRFPRGSGALNLVDFPGLYSLQPLTRDEQVAVEAYLATLQGTQVAGIVCVLDATRLEQSLFLGLQVQDTASRADKRVLFALNMMDEIRQNGATIDTEGLSRELGARVYPISARSGEGIEALESALLDWARMPQSGSEAEPTSQPENSANPRARARELRQKFGPQTDLLIRTQSRIDRVLLSGFWGGLIFLASMAILFQAIFSWAQPLMSAVQSLVTWSGDAVVSRLPAGIFSDFIGDALFAGAGAFLVFVPQIFVLTFLIGLLQDSGYLARAAVLCHRPLHLFGLSGRSFVPMLSGHACAIPAIFAARIIESPRKRLITLMAIPLMSCSARLPVYSLLIAAVIPAHQYLGGLIGLQGLSFLALYLFGIVTALVITAITSRTGFKQTTDAPFVLELPPYRVPDWKPLIRNSLSQSRSFVTKAGPTILAVTVVIWALGYFPAGKGHLDQSWLAMMGRWIEPLFTPLHLDWRYGLAILSSFLAREVFVTTLGTLFGIAEAKENLTDLASQVTHSGLTAPSALALLAFYAIALQCVATMAVLRRETGSWKLPAGLFIGYGALSYLLAIVTYQLALWLSH